MNFLRTHKPRHKKPRHKNPTFEFGGRCPNGKRILAFHGYGGGVDANAALMTPFAEMLAKEGGLSVSVAHYRSRRGDGATLEDMCADARTAFGAFVKASLRGEEMFLLGASFGAILLVEALLEAPMAVQEQIAGIILLNPITDIGPEGFQNAVLSGDDRREFSPRRRLEGHSILNRLRCLMLHGEGDVVVPVAKARALASLFPAGACDMRTYATVGHGFFNRPPLNISATAAIRDFVGAPFVGSPFSAAERPAAIATAPCPPITQRRIPWPKGATLLYGIGAQKAGTSWLFECLAQNPDCHTTPTKELHYFDVLFKAEARRVLHNRLGDLHHKVARLDPAINPHNRTQLRQIAHLSEQMMIHAVHPGEHHGYLNYLLRDHTEQQIICDFTPAYAILEADHFSQMAQVAPSKFVFIVRDPVDRLWAEIRMATEAETPGLSDQDFANACACALTTRMQRFEISTMGRTNYARTMAHLERAVPKRDIFYGFYEHLFATDTLDELSDFLNISALKAPPSGMVNKGREAPLPSALEREVSARLRPQYDAAEAKFGDALPPRWRHRMA